MQAWWVVADVPVGRCVHERLAAWVVSRLPSSRWRISSAPTAKGWRFRHGSNANMRTIRPDGAAAGCGFTRNGPSWFTIWFLIPDWMLVPDTIGLAIIL